MVRLDLSFLNTFAVDLDGQPITQFRSANNQGLLVYLALHSNKPQPRDVLATLFWPEETEKTARHNLRQALYHLRTILADTKSNGDPFLKVNRQTAQFNPQSDYNLDVQQFLEAIDRNDLETAVSLYHGDLLPGFTCDSLEFEEWLRQEQERLHQLALEAMFELAQDYLADSRFQEAQTIARRQLKLEPWREKAFRQLMRAYALDGDRSGALATYEQSREVLRDELGVEPTTETVSLYEEIVSGRYGALKSGEKIEPPVRVRDNLPADTTPLVGRELELSHIDHQVRIERQRLVSIVAPGGMGKTRLAIAVGELMLPLFDDGVYFVDLASIENPTEIISAIASALNFQAPDQSRDLKPQLLEAISRQSLFLILDNFEHLLEGAALVDEMLKTCPQVTILVTTRQRLNLASESRYNLSGLLFPESAVVNDALEYTAVQFFTTSANRVRSQFVLTPENTPDVLRICHLVQGMPLGLLLAAAWLELLSPAEIATEIEKSLDFLAADLVDLPPRQRSMLAVFQRSWEMMTVSEQGVLAKLSVFRGGFTREASEEVAGANLRILLALVNKSLLQRQQESGRYTMHELLRQFAAMKRRESDAKDQTLLAHCRYFADLVPGEVRRSLSFYPFLIRLRYAADRENFFRAWDYALAQGQSGELAHLARAVADFHWERGIVPAPVIQEAMQVLKSGGLAETHPSMLELRLSYLASIAGSAEQAHRLRELQIFIALVEEHGSHELRFWTYDTMRELFRDLRDQEIVTWIEKMRQEALSMEDEILTKMAEGYLLWSRTVLRMDEKSEESKVLEQLHDLLVYFKPDYARNFVVFISYWSLSIIQFNRENFELALQFGQRALNISKGWHNLWWISNVVWTLTLGYMDLGAPEKAKKQQLDCLEWHLAIGQEWQTLGLLMTINLYFPMLIGDEEKSLSVLAMVYNHPDTNDHYRNVIDNEKARLEKGMEASVITAAWERGQTLDFDTAVALVREALTSVK